MKKKTRNKKYYEPETKIFPPSYDYQHQKKLNAEIHMNLGEQLL